MEQRVRYYDTEHIPDRDDHITPRERLILLLLATGMRRRAVANVLSCSEQTVKCHLARLYQRWQVPSLESALVRQVALGVITRAELKEADEVCRRREGYR